MTRPCKPRPIEAKVQADVAEFLARGGEIDHREHGDSGLHDATFIPHTLNAKQRYNYRFSNKVRADVHTTHII